MEIIKSLLSCNITPVYGRLDRKVTLTDFANAQQRSFWNRCRNSQAESACIRSMETLCRNTSVLTTKVIRLGMDVAGDLLEALPTLKVIYLLRDPRGILRSSALYSRLQTWPPGTRSPAICGRMVHDVTTSQVLVQKYPDRFAIVRYEDLSLAPIQTTRLIYNFIGVEFSVADLNRVKHQTQADDQEETREGFYRKNASVTALRWRKEIHWRLVEETDVECRLIYNITGYRAAVSEDVLRDLSKSLISPPFSLTGVLYPGGVL